MAKNGLGRKPWIPDLERVEELAAQGLTNEQIAACLGICESTLYNKKREFLEFLEAIKKGGVPLDLRRSSRLCG